MYNIEYKDIKKNPLFLQECITDNGFVIVKNIFENKFIEKLNREIESLKLLRKVKVNQFAIANAFGNYRKFSKLLDEDRIKSVLKSYFNNKKFGFWGHSDILVNVYSPWHKDDGGEDIKTNYFRFDSIKKEDAVIIKCAFYLQDHDYDRNGLWVIPKSHREYFPGKLKPFNTKIKKNDLLLFDARLTHRGSQITFLPYFTENKFLFKLANKVNSKITQYISKLFCLKLSKNRNAIFFTVGELNKTSHSFGVNMVENAKNKGYPISSLDIDLKKKLNKEGIFTYP